MKIATPVITLIVGLALAASLLVSSMSAVSGEKASLARASAAANATAAASAAATASPAQPTSAGVSATAAASAASPSPSSSQGFVIPPHANYVGEVQGNLGSVALVVHDTFAIAYFCNGKTQEAWLRGTPQNGKLSMTGKNHASITANYALGHARGTVIVDGISH